MKKNKKQPKELYLQRVKCDCVAQKHELINNCLSCGKVVCALEGEGQCLSCGEVVTRPDGQYITNDESLFPSLGKDELVKISQERSSAILHKNTLVSRDKSTNLVQNIYDESLDYYDVSENQWLDEESRQNAIDRLLEKEKFVEKEELKTKVYFDPVTGQFVTEEFSFDETSFRDEGKNYMREKEQKQFEAKMQKAKTTMDTRVLNNDKAKELMADLRTEISGRSQQAKGEVRPGKAGEVKPRLAELVVEDETENTN